MTDQGKKWIKTLKQFELNHDAKVSCPECNNGFLKLQTVLWEKDRKIDWYLICDSCKKYNVATKNLNN